MNIELIYVLIAIGVGFGATLVMDLWGIFVKHTFNIPSPNYCFVGRWLRYMPEGVFLHSSIAAAPQKPAECTVGWIAHYAMGVIFALTLVLLPLLSGCGSPRFCGRWSWALLPSQSHFLSCSRHSGWASRLRRRQTLLKPGSEASRITLCSGSAYIFQHWLSASCSRLMPNMKYKGSCHCGRVAFEVEGEIKGSPTFPSSGQPYCSEPCRQLSLVDRPWPKSARITSTIPFFGLPKGSPTVLCRRVQ